MSLLAGLLLIAANLRAPITSVAPVLETLQEAFALSPAQAGLLATLPLLAFGFISPFVALFARVRPGAIPFRRPGFRRGRDRRAVAGPGLVLYPGAAVTGAGIAVGNVLLPSLVKRDSPFRVPTITGCAPSSWAARRLASAVAVPLAGWGGAMAAFGDLAGRARLIGQGGGR